MAQAGQDPVAMLKKYGGRIQLLHLKDRKAGFPTSQMLGHDAEHMTEVGSGTIDWKAVILKAEKTSVKHYFVERQRQHSGVRELAHKLRLLDQDRGLGSSRHV